MSERGEWFVCLVREGAVRSVCREASGAVGVWRRRVPVRPGVEKCVVRWIKPVTVQYARRVLSSAYRVEQWRGEIEYMASVETRAAIMEKLRRDYERIHLQPFTITDTYTKFI